MGYYAVVLVNNDWGLASFYPLVTLNSGVNSISPTKGAFAPSPVLFRGISHVCL